MGVGFRRVRYKGEGGGGGGGGEEGEEEGGEVAVSILLTYY